MADKNVGIEIKTTADTTGAKQAQASIENLNPVVKKLGTETETTGKNVGKMGMLTNQAGYQVGDFFTQIEMGTPVMRAFSQQAGQMAGALSSAGVLSGKAAMTFAGIGAALPILAIALPKISDMLFGTSEAADKAAESIKQMGEKITKIEITKLDDAKQALAFTLQSARELTGQYPLLDAASQAAAAAMAKDAATVAEAQDLVDSLLGKQVDKWKQIEQAANRMEAVRRADFEKQIKDQKKQAEEAFKIAKKAQDDLDLMIQDRENRRAEMAKKKAVLDEDRAALVRARVLLSTDEGRSQGWGQTPGTPARQAAARMVSDKSVTDRMAAIEAELSKLAADLEKEAKPGGPLDMAKLALSKATQTAIDTQAAIEQSTERLENTAKKQETVAKLETVAQMSEQQAKDTLAVLEKITPTSEAAKNAVGSLKTMAGDLEIQIGENDRFNQNLSNLIGQLQLSKGMGDIMKEVMRIQEQQKVLYPELMKIKATNDRYEQAMKTLNLRK